MPDHNTEMHLFVRVVLASPLEEPLSLENKPPSWAPQDQDARPPLFTIVRSSPEQLQSQGPEPSAVRHY
jgi:hypothetical protein